nr:cytochrome c [candidate division Zixibacteria bacterium]
MLMVFWTIMVLIFMAAFMAGCARERPSTRTPIHVNPNMDHQPKYRPQSESNFFADSASMRVPAAGTVAHGQLRDNIVFYQGKKPTGEFVKENPIPITMELLRRGHERFDIYCSPCHSRLGDGKGIMLSRGYVPPPSFHTDRIRSIPDGQIFDVISNGFGNMPSYSHQIPADDGWTIVAYLRALQLSQKAGVDDVPVELRDRIK